MKTKIRLAKNGGIWGNDSVVASDGGRAGEWFSTFLEYMGSSYSWTFWSLNPNSGDTEGILEYDWVTPHQWKLDALAPYLAPMID